MRFDSAKTSKSIIKKKQIRTPKKAFKKMRFDFASDQNGDNVNAHVSKYCEKHQSQSLKRNRSKS